MSITDYLIRENLELRKQLKDNYIAEQSKNENDIGSRFYLLSRNPLVISGILISEGEWKNVKFSYDEMKKAMPKFLDKPVLVLHGNDPDYNDAIVGKLTKITPNDELKALTFEAEITNEQAIKDIIGNRFDAVSIGGSFNELVQDGNGVPLGVDFEPIEVSLTPSPACKRCLIFTANEIGLSASKQEKFKCDVCNNVFDTKLELKKHKEECKMNVSEDNTKNDTIKVDEVDTSNKDVAVKKVYVCPFCDKEFDKKEDCIAHIKTEEKYYYKPYEAPEKYEKPYEEKSYGKEVEVSSPQATITADVSTNTMPESNNIVTASVDSLTLKMSNESVKPEQTTASVTTKTEVAPPETIATTTTTIVDIATKKEVDKIETTEAKPSETPTKTEPEKIGEAPMTQTVVVTPTMEVDTADKQGERKYTIDEALDMAAKDGTLVEFAAQLFLESLKKKREDEEDNK